MSRLDELNDTIQLSPSGIQFQKPVVITLPYDSDIDEEKDVVVVGIYDETTGKWDVPTLVDINIEVNKLGVMVSHFSLIDRFIGGLWFDDISTSPEFEITKDSFCIINSSEELDGTGCSMACNGFAAYSEWYFRNKRNEACLRQAYDRSTAAKVACETQVKYDKFFLDTIKSLYKLLAGMDVLTRDGWTEMWLRWSLVLSNSPKVFGMCTTYHENPFDDLNDGHAVLVIGWNNSKKCYRVYDPNFNATSRELYFDSLTGFADYWSDPFSPTSKIYKVFVNIPSGCFEDIYLDHSETDTIYDYAQHMELAYNSNNADLMMERISKDFMRYGVDYDCDKEMREWDFSRNVYDNYIYHINSVSYEEDSGKQLARINRTVTHTYNGFPDEDTDDVTLIKEDGKWKHYGNQLGYQDPALLEAVTCQGIDTSSEFSWKPIGPKQVFTEEDFGVYIFYEFDHLQNGSVITSTWYAPNGYAYDGVNFQIDIEGFPACARTDHTRWEIYYIEGYEDWWKDKVGNWYIDLKLDGVLMKRLYFEYRQ